MPEGPRADAGLAWARLVAMLLVVLLHSVVPYMSNWPGGLRWVVRAPEAGAGGDVAFFLLRAVGTAMFSLMGGSLFAVACRREGPGPALRRRMPRIGLPILASGILVLPATFIVWQVGLTLQGDANASKLLLGNLSSRALRGLTGPAHLWYLVYLLIITPLAAAAWAAFAGAGPRSSGPSRLSAALWLALVGLSGFGACAAFPETLGSFRNSIIPAPGRLLLHAALFALGMLAPGGDRLRRATSLWPAALVLAGAGAWAAWRAGLDAPPRWADGARGAYVALGAAGLLGAGLRLPGTRLAALRARLDGAAFATYLVHLPLCAATSVALAPRAGPLVTIPASVLAGLAGGLALRAAASRVAWGWVLGGAPRAAVSKKATGHKAVPSPLETPPANAAT